jgi:eukaryotic-like serine/threonine-protein kinase
MGSIGSATIEYTGLAFILRQVSGDVFVNGTRAASNHTLPSSCVIALGAPALGAIREFVAFDISHPEVAL